MTGYAFRAVVVTAVLLSAVTGVYAAPESESRSGLDSVTFAQSEVDPDSVVIDLSLAEDGSATWTVAYRVALTSQNESDAFESLQDDIDANTSEYLGAFRDRMERTARSAENATGRSMTIRNLSVSTSVETVQQYGTVAYRFEWTNFAATDGNRLRVGDALAGFFLEENTRLVVSWPDNYRKVRTAPSPEESRDRTVVWEGPVEFGPDGPTVVVTTAGAFPTTAVALSMGVAVVIALVSYRLLKDRFPWGGDTEAEPTETPDTATDPAPSAELLSNEERVLRLLEERGGRVKQQAVATEFDWTDAKTSQVVTTLREDDAVDVFRLGRENVIVLPEESDL